MNVSAMNCIQRLLHVEHAVTQRDLVAAALEARALAAGVLQHREDRLMQLQVQMQHARRRRLQAARSERGVDQTRDAHAGFVDHAEQQRELLAAVAGGNGEQHALAFGLVRPEQRFGLRERDIRGRAREPRRPRQRLGAQARARSSCARAAASDARAPPRRSPVSVLLVVEDRDARRLGQHLAVLAAAAGEQQAGIDELECEQVISPACAGSAADRSSDPCCARTAPASAAAGAGRTSARSSATARRTWR